MNEGALQVCKKSLTESQMSDAAYVDQAAAWSKELTRWRTRGPGDLENAMRSIERDYGIDYWFLWRLRYRRSQIQDIGVSPFVKIWSAYEAERARQRRKFELQAENAKKIAGSDAALIRAALALAGDKDGET